MNEEIQYILLNGMPFGQFIAHFLVGVFGIAYFFLTNLFTAIETDPTTPPTFKWIYFIKGLIRLILAFMSLAFTIIYFSEIMNFIAEVPEDIEVEINGWSALIGGISADQLSKKLVSSGFNVYRVASNAKPKIFNKK